MNTEDVPPFLSRRVPALASVIDDAVHHLKSTYGADIPISDHVLGVVLAPLVSRMLRSDDPKDRSTLYSLFAALDELLDDPNPNMENVVFVSFLEQISQDRGDWERARAYMGERLQRKLICPREERYLCRGSEISHRERLRTDKVRVCFHQRPGCHTLRWVKSCGYQEHHSLPEVLAEPQG